MTKGIETTIQTSGKVSSQVKENGYGATAFGILSVILIILLFVLLRFFRETLKKAEKNTQDLIKQQQKEMTAIARSIETMNENMKNIIDRADNNTKESHKEMIQNIKQIFEGINESIIGVYQVVSDSKELTETQVKSIIETHKKNLINSFQNELVRIVDDNNLSDNITLIIPELKSFFKDSMREGFNTLLDSGIKNIEFEQFWDKIKEERERGMSELIECFTEAIESISHIETGITYTKHYKDKLEGEKLQQNYSTKRNRRKEDYKELKRKLKLSINETGNKIFEKLKHYIKECKS